mmetsp:Transcript_70245/g.168263  ORF Transcript_70245/g.168263 Transcript_70245/m.168263 type:complete len:349 (-) Transcript_70245:137-1183(-)
MRGESRARQRPKASACGRAWWARSEASACGRARGLALAGALAGGGVDAALAALDEEIDDQLGDPFCTSPRLWQAVGRRHRALAGGEDVAVDVVDAVLEPLLVDVDAETLEAVDLAVLVTLREVDAADAIGVVRVREQHPELLHVHREALLLEAEVEHPHDRLLLEPHVVGRVEGELVEELGGAVAADDRLGLAVVDDLLQALPHHLARLERHLAVKAPGGLEAPGLEDLDADVLEAAREGDGHEAAVVEAHGGAAVVLLGGRLLARLAPHVLGPPHRRDALGDRAPREELLQVDGEHLRLVQGREEHADPDVGVLLEGRRHRVHGAAPRAPRHQAARLWDRLRLADLG